MGSIWLRAFVRLHVPITKVSDFIQPSLLLCYLKDIMTASGNMSLAFLVGTLANKSSNA